MVMLAPVALVLIIGAVVMLATFGVGLRLLAICAGAAGIIGFVFCGYGVRFATEAQIESGDVHSFVLVGVLLIIGSLISGITITIIALVRAMTQASESSK